MEQQILPIGKQWNHFEGWSTPEIPVELSVYELDFILYTLIIRFAEGDMNPYVSHRTRISQLGYIVQEAHKQQEQDFLTSMVEALLSPAEIKQLYEGLENGLYDNHSTDQARMNAIYDAVPAKVKIFLTEISTPAFMHYQWEDNGYFDRGKGAVKQNVHIMLLGALLGECEEADNE